jgi:uncharacterized protein (UPF0332 family)
VFHGARALLFSLGLEPRSHRAVAPLVGEHFVKTGRLAPTFGRLIATMQRNREDADYETGAVFTANEARSALDDAQGFLREVRRILGLAD